ncbi:MAG: hypothetical protein H7328_09970 [Bdellovibrio sp.]|nr:hypothetical protein [Bdellovibrio sp.]
MKSFVFISPEEHFAEVVKEACQERQVKTQPQVEAYLVHLLKFYLDSKNLHRPLLEDSTTKPVDTFAEMYLQAMNAGAPRNREMMRTVADRSLYLTGFFADSFQRKIVDIDYYAEIGSAAYSNLSSWTRQDTVSAVFDIFSKRFLEYVEVLNYISEKSQIQGDQNVLRLYDRYLRTGSELAREKLTELGVVTLPKERLKLSKA